MENTIQQNNISKTSQQMMSKEEYEEKMIEAFVQKPEKFFYYKNAFRKYNINGINRMAWNWSWWGFFGNWAFLLYRKAYLASLISFLSGIILSFIPFIGGLIWSILNGGYDVFFIYKKFKNLKVQIEASSNDYNERIHMMYELAKPNRWVIWVIVAFYVLVIIGIFTVMINSGNSNY